jgi:hypothetical protein
MLTSQPTRPLCEHCQVSLAKSNGVSKHGFKQWHKYCVSCAKILYNPKFEYLKHKKATCEKCGFIPEDNCQIDIVKDNDIYKTLCANCHRLYKKRLKENKSILDITVDADVIL